MPCVRCTGLAQEVEQGDAIDEGLCNFCGQHFLKSTNHTGPWRVYVQSDCQDCRWIPVNTNNCNQAAFSCYTCNNVYNWTKPNGWWCVTLPPSISLRTRFETIPEPRQYGTLITLNTGCEECWPHVKQMVNSNQQGHITCNLCNRTYSWIKPGYLTEYKSGDRKELAELHENTTITHTSFDTPRLEYKEKIPRSAHTETKITEPETYESAYWKFVNSSDYDDATYWKNQMLSMVTENLEPRPDGKSWVAEPKARIQKPNTNNRFPLLRFCLIILICVVVPVLINLGIT